MNILSATSEAIIALLSGDAELWLVIATSLSVAAVALLAATLPAIGGAYLLAGNNFRGKTIIVALLHALLATPTVTVGLVLFLLLSKEGPLGGLELLFTPAAVALGQFIIALPIFMAFAYNSISGKIIIVRETVITLGATKLQTFLSVLHECRLGLTAAALAAFGRIISEVGCALLVGGNIAGSTRTLPTAIALETSKGLYAQGIALGLVLLVLALVAALLLFTLRNRDD